MCRYNFTFYNVDPEYDEVLNYTEKTIWANNQKDAWRIAREWAKANGYNDIEGGELA